MPVNMDIPSPYSLRAIRVFQRSSSDDLNTNLGSMWRGHFSLATVPIAPVADGLAEVARLWARAVAAIRHDNFEWREDVLSMPKAPQPSAYARCRETVLDIIHLNQLQLSFPILAGVQFADGNTFDGIVQQLGFCAESSSDMTASVIGYAHSDLSYRGKTQKAAVGVMVPYVIVTVLHLWHSLC